MNNGSEVGGSLGAHLISNISNFKEYFFDVSPFMLNCCRIRYYCRVRIIGSFYGFKKWVSADRFWIEHDSLELHTTSYIHILRVIWICHTWLKETGHSKIILLLQLSYGLQNS